VEEEEEEGLFKADAVNEEDPRRRRRRKEGGKGWVGGGWETKGPVWPRMTNLIVHCNTNI